MTTILNEGIRKKTRRAHTCCVCEGAIVKGSECNYQTNTGTDESDFGTAYWHIDCDPDWSSENEGR